MRQLHVAGERMFVDYAGTTLKVVDGTTGEVRVCQLFVAALGASNYTYAEATFTQRLVDWIGSHVRAFEFFGGVTAQIVSDNLRSGITKACFYEPAVNRTYAEMAAHYDTAVGPCDFGLRGVRGDPTRRHQVAAREPQHETPGLIGVRRVEAYHFTRNRSLASELVRLVIGACHQRHAADAGRNAEIILDARRRAGLTAGRTAIQHQNGEPLGSRVDRSRKARHPR
jgi:hypothetical protein